MMGSEFSESTHAGRELSVRDSYTTWSASAYSSYSQSILDDIPTPSTSYSDTPSFDSMYDFDYSCLDGLDEKLLYHPMESFADLCWADAVEDYTDRSATPTQSHPAFESNSPRYSDISVGSTTYYGSDEEEDSQSHRKGLISGSGTSTPRATKSQCPVIPPFEFNGGDRTSFILFESYFATAAADLGESAGSCSHSVANLSKHSLPSRIVSICSAFPSRLIKA